MAPSPPAPRGNGYSGVLVEAAQNVIAGNEISGNGGLGVFLSGSAATGNTL